MISPPGKGASNSESQSKTNVPQLIVFGVVGLVVFFLVRYLLGFSAGASASPNVTVVPSEVPEVFTPVVLVVTATPEPTNTSVPTPVVITEFREVEVTVVSVQYINNPVEVEVTRVVESIIYPTPTPSLANDTGLVCIYVEGVTGVYIDDRGVAGNQCYSFRFGSPVTDIQLRVTN